MINRDDIEAGDKVYTRDGGCLVAREVGGVIWIGGLGAHHWHSKGGYLMYEPHPLDIIRIEKAPKPVVERAEFNSVVLEWAAACHLLQPLDVCNALLEKAFSIARSQRPDTSAKVDVESAGDFVTRLGMDGRLWAKEMHAMFPQIPEADLLGWCCNMIMAGYDNARGAPINGDHAQYLIDSAALQSPRSDTSAKPLLCPPDEGYYCEKHERGSRELGTACSECYRESLATDTSAVELVREYMSLSARAKAGLLHVGILNGVENWAADCDKLETKAEQWLKKQGA